jgi:hypothetical protein
MLGSYITTYLKNRGNFEVAKSQDVYRPLRATSSVPERMTQ